MDADSLDGRSEFLTPSWPASLFQSLTNRSGSFLVM
jgi:hypothetical protein